VHSRVERDTAEQPRGRIAEAIGGQGVRRFVNRERKEENEKRNEDAGEVDGGQAASVLELLGLLQGKRADRADEADEHQDKTRNRDRRGPEQQHTATQENDANENVKRVGWNVRNPAPAREQCKTDAAPAYALTRFGETGTSGGRFGGQALMRVGAGGEVRVEQREAELPRALECPVEPNQPSHLGRSSDLRFGGSPAQL
jgi:hypothetical protein